MDFERAVSSSWAWGNEKGKTANSRSDWFRFQRSPPASNPDAKVDDYTGECSWAGMTTKKDVLVSNETAMIWNSYYNTHFVVPNKRQLPNFSLIFRYLMKICQASFFSYCFDIFSCLTNYLLTLWCILLLFQVRVKSFNNYCTMFFFQNNLEKAEIKIFTWCVIFHNILRLLLDREFTENTCIWIRYPHSS